MDVNLLATRYDCSDRLCSLVVTNERFLNLVQLSLAYNGDAAVSFYLGTSSTIAFELGKKPVCGMLGGMEWRYGQYFRYESGVESHSLAEAKKAGLNRSPVESLIAYPHAGLMMP